MSLFELLGVLVLAYTALAAVRGEVYAKKGPWGESISRGHSPGRFWTVIVIYLGLGLALLTVF